jgi:predicted nucleic acid-binding protein
LSEWGLNLSLRRKAPGVWQNWEERKNRLDPFREEGGWSKKMVLVDTSVWVEHLRKKEDRLAGLLNDGQVACHPFIIGELACGHLKNRSEILTLLKVLPSCPWVEHDEIFNFIDINRLTGLGLGYIDMSLLASAALSGMNLWTIDRRFQHAAIRMHSCYQAGNR